MFSYDFGPCIVGASNDWSAFSKWSPDELFASLSRTASPTMRSSLGSFYPASRQPSFNIAFAGRCHVSRMRSTRLPRITLFGDLANGKRSCGGPNRSGSVEDTSDTDHIDLETWENPASNPGAGPSWRREKLRVEPLIWREYVMRSQEAKKGIGRDGDDPRCSDASGSRQRRRGFC